ncbi:MAG: type II secretion system protein [Phycisphaeraceae bacterium]|nr:type II secretion system protein [Phycisphaeraceae bacterium]
MSPQTHRQDLLARIASSTVGGVFLIAAVGKALHPDRFADLLARVAPIDSALFAQVLGIVVAAAEAALGVALMLAGWKSRRLLAFGVSALLAFTAFLGWLWARHGAVSCGCFSLFDSMTGGSSGPAWGLVRNGSLIWLLCIARNRTARRQPSADSGPASSDQSSAPSAVRAFSLVEILVAVSLIAVLVAIALPALRSVRARGKAADSLSNLRQAMVALGAYSADFKDSWPYFQTPGSFSGPIYVRGVRVSWSYFAAGRTLWPNLIWPAYIDSQELFLGFDVSLLRDRNVLDGWDPDTIRSRYLLSNVAFALPDWWVGDDPPANPDLFAATRTTHVQCPARKGILVDSAFGWNPTTPTKVVLACRADSSAGEFPFTTEDPTTIVPRWRFGVIEESILSTRNGWRGIDYGM